MEKLDFFLIPIGCCVVVEHTKKFFLNVATQQNSLRIFKKKGAFNNKDSSLVSILNNPSIVANTNPPIIVSCTLIQSTSITGIEIKHVLQHLQYSSNVNDSYKMMKRRLTGPE